MKTTRTRAHVQEVKVYYILVESVMECVHKSVSYAVFSLFYDAVDTSRYEGGSVHIFGLLLPILT